MEHQIAGVQQRANRRRARARMDGTVQHYTCTKPVSNSKPAGGSELYMLPRRLRTSSSCSKGHAYTGTGDTSASIDWQRKREALHVVLRYKT